MELSIPNQMGAVEEIIWQLSIKLKNYTEVYVYNPIPSNDLQKFIMGLKFLTHESYCNNCIIHSHNLYASLSISLNNRGFKHILTLHYPPNITKSKQRRKIYSYILKYLDNAGTIITAPSLYIKELLKGMGIQRAIFIPNGVDTTTFNPSKRSDELREKLLEGKDALIVNVGRIHPDKNQLALLVALNKLVNYYGYRNVKLALIGPTSGVFTRSGENPYYRLLVEYIEKNNLRPYVTFMELPRKEEVVRVLASSDIYVHASKVEAAPLALLEAMASKLPIIAFDLPFYKGYIVNNMNALLAPPFDVNKLTSCLFTLINDISLRKKLAENTFRLAKKFSWDSLQFLYLDLYKGCSAYGNQS
jgi:glycosyltransferase involved in cell wall biosynthesis